MDGLNLKFARNPLEGTFDFDEYGALVPKTENLRMELVQEKVSRQLKADSGLYRRLTDMYYKTDVEFTDNPYGNTPTCGVGAKLYGKRPLNIKFRDRLDWMKKRTPQIDKQLSARERRIVAHQKEYMQLCRSLEPANKGTTEDVQWQVEMQQVMTGGGFDGNSPGEVAKSAALFCSKGASLPQFGNNRFSQLTVAGALHLRDKLIAAGLKLGSLSPIGCTKVRMEQDNDGLIGFPVYSKGFSPLDQDIALRILIDSGVDTRRFVGTTVVDQRTGEQVKYRVIDALGYMLDNTIVNDPAEFASIVTLLARIQKHAWKEENGEIVPKKPKTRSVYPNAAKPGIAEAMIITPFNDMIKDLGFKHIPSLQDKPTRVQFLKELIMEARADEYEAYALDESQYDATVSGGALATIMYYAVRPFFNAKYYDWVDLAIYSLCYKYILFDTAIAGYNAEEFEEAKKLCPWVDVKPFTVIGVINGLISGAKFTHVGGSMYGLVEIHYVIPIILKFEPRMGVQAGDDCVFFYPRGRVNFKDAAESYGPVEDAAKMIGIDINKLKQFWIVVNDELVVIFLQDVYHESTDTWGPGSIFRPLSAVFFSERNKGLSIAEQYMAEIARMNQGADAAFVKDAVRMWLTKEQFIGSLFKEYGVNAFKIIVDSIGDSVEEIAKRIDVGSFTFGVDKKDLQTGTLPILPIIAEVASEMTYTVSAAEAMKSLGNKEALGVDPLLDGLTETVPDIGDSDDVRAD